MKKSRKWFLVLLITIISTVGTFIPPILSKWVFKENEGLIILSGSHFVTLISLVVSAYFGFNVWQKRIVNEPTKNNEDGEA